MKLKILIFFIGISSVSYSQIQKYTLGIRSGEGGNNFGFSNEVSFQYGLSDINRVEIDVGMRLFNDNGFSKTTYLSLAGIYHWVKPIVGSFTWFYGLGAQFATTSFSRNDTTGVRISDRRFSLGIGGQTGVDYDFSSHNVPIQFGFDVRPMILFENNRKPEIGGDFAFHIRYIFKQP